MNKENEHQLALSVLNKEASKIRTLINSQRNHLCISQCKAFEEVVDTQMYGFSRQIDFAIKMNILKHEEGQLILADLERELNQVYIDVYETQKEMQE
ncbi:DUF1507 family protein [Vagococcus xieshaowenii]|uniref:DUF1507 family protein n=1 Tax=Vagococcus xieshaowenii TaxID=2562451 RepID=A0AAJ5EFZ7_9ENTE|nr:DUF1507 family protein [Vagococcus xieshaowenii]QCA28371.1 DUF1507 family protein [Vagococcus xieshaowenii]TFZ42872.1 DUF1507 family protein [Vagococcus xieshaowenii]